ncbi:hypothetical protein AGLY_011284 [Aphis glycines]|uniref:Uncharacterized protein n=1 Tax=Aphis glycines TaxID=307491 RepID=A0A6G0TDE4_APHGL|nr:hypothetical protein AGLY_011284 [Aphis glycines]
MENLVQKDIQSYSYYNGDKLIEIYLISTQDINIKLRIASTCIDMRYNYNKNNRRTWMSSFGVKILIRYLFFLFTQLYIKIHLTSSSIFSEVNFWKYFYNTFVYLEFTLIVINTDVIFKLSFQSINAFINPKYIFTSSWVLLWWIRHNASVFFFFFWKDKYLFDIYSATQFKCKLFCKQICLFCDYKYRTKFVYKMFFFLNLFLLLFVVRIFIFVVQHDCGCCGVECFFPIWFGP